MRSSTLLALLAIAAAEASLAAPAEREAPRRDEGGTQREPDGAAHAQFLEELGKTDAAAREYEAAFAKSRAPEMLYRLALCRRALGEYAAAREALRGYLREAPDGPLRDEVERQLAQLAVLIEARGLLNQQPAKSRKRGPPPSTPAAKQPATSTPPKSAVEAIEVPPAPAVTSAHALAADVPTPVLPAASPSQPPPTEPAQAASPAERKPPPSGERAGPMVGTQQSFPTGIVSNQHEATGAAPAAALRVEPPVPDSLRARWKSSAPWLGGSAVALAAGGIGLCVNAHQIAGDLDARFSQGALTRADLPRYSRVTAEGVAGSALLVVAALAGATAAVLAW
jgi:hypothetical protein